MFASLFARTSQGISYPYLYLNSAASPLARSTEALASAIEPVITQPTDGEILKTCETEEGSINLSCGCQRLAQTVDQGVLQELSFEKGQLRTTSPLRQRM